MLEDITRTIAPGDTSIYDIEARGLTCIDADLPDFQIRFGGGGEATYRVGFEYAPPDGFKRFQVRNTRAAPLNVTFTVWDGQFRDRRQISSDPQSFEPTTLEDHRGTSYFGGTIATSPAASDTPRIWLENPDGSGVITVIRKLWLSTSLAAFVEVVPAAFAVTPGGNKVSQGVVFPTFAGDPDGNTTLWTDWSPSLPGFGGGRNFRVFMDAVGLAGDVDLKSPIILPSPGRVALTSSRIGAGSQLVVGFEALEVPAG